MLYYCSSTGRCAVLLNRCSNGVEKHAMTSLSLGTHVYLDRTSIIDVAVKCIAVLKRIKQRMKALSVVLTM